MSNVTVIGPEKAPTITRENSIRRTPREEIVFLARRHSYTNAEVEAGLEFADRKARRSHPPGSFTKGGFIAEERTAATDSVSDPTKKYPYSEMRAARTAHHCAELFDADDLKYVRRIAYAYERLLGDSDVGAAIALLIKGLRARQARAIRRRLDKLMIGLHPAQGAAIFLEWVEGLSKQDGAIFWGAVSDYLSCFLLLPQEEIQHICRRFRDKRPQKLLGGLPNKVTVYRGQDLCDDLGLCWTTDHLAAKNSATGKRDPIIYEMSVQRADIVLVHDNQDLLLFAIQPHMTPKPRAINLAVA